ncbi:hypothetical protein RM533_03875 [Croceicoccus sp. F390]|uniref:Glycosyl transferase n=1 Tax=Croceicoccus esteveae TaxID=3075597 RepID=A0ABU2ZFE5_9SPHN|nr:hypothetical protein [Croceicoccus sp. F390]MDT0575318.1 hypothetical protein [Croceicoccus sp. F390]
MSRQDRPSTARPACGQRIAFLFNHDQIHQVRHALPIALALARTDFPGEIIVATTTPALAAEVEWLSHVDGSSNIRHVTLKTGWLARLAGRLLGAAAPAAKLLVYQQNLDFFRSLDMLVVTEKTSLLLKNRYRLDKLFMVHTRHGAGDRAIGFDPASARFDHVLCSGPLIADRLVQQAHVDPDRISIVGYPKFDTVDVRQKRPENKAGHRRTILYNPHPSPRLSSWYRHGRSLLRVLVEDRDQNVIFAPHVMLFARPIVITVDPLAIAMPGRLPADITRAPNLLIDLGSRASTDMTYTQAADIYVGDVSSQIYEFIVNPRPCVFVNSHGVDWRGKPDFAHWQAGPVIDEPAQLPAAIAKAVELHEAVYRPIQQRLIAERFDLSLQPSSARAAARIAQLAAGLRRQENGAC